MKKTIVISILVLLSTVIYLFSVLSKWPSSEADNFFSSPIYTAYRNQLQQFPGTFVKTSNDPRSSHEAFVNNLRHALSNDKSSPLVQKAVLDLFLTVDLSQEMQNYLFSFVSPPQPNEKLDAYLPNALEKIREKLKASQTPHRHIFWEDQLLSGNVPQRMDLEGVALVRMAQPCIDRAPLPWWLVRPVLSPEFALFLELQPSHLYVNLMKRHGKEGALSNVLESSEKEFPNLSVITLDRDSAFYWQENGKFPDDIDSVIFKQLFALELQNGEGYFWSQNLDEGWHTHLKGLINDVYHTYFDKEKPLTRLERQDLIELVHVAILDALVDQLRPASMNITCRQAMDRAPALQMIWLTHRQQITDAKIVTLLLVPPVMIHNRSSHLSRIERFISNIDYFGKYKDMNPKGLAHSSPSYP